MHGYLRALGGSEVIDIDDANVGRGFNKIDRILCPEYGIPMIRMVIRDQHNIWIECCSICTGVFFDAGEFSDFKDWSSPRKSTSANLAL
ncbi:MAG: hypothetical protein ACI915_002746 [Gammaproteobacteria bacterium]|jgi:hypothetical protein